MGSPAVMPLKAECVNSTALAKPKAAATMSVLEYCILTMYYSKNLYEEFVVLEDKGSVNAFVVALVACGFSSRLEDRFAVLT